MTPSPFFCQVCFGQITSAEELEDSHALDQCGHRFCRGCLISFLETSINNAELQPRCFFLSSLMIDNDNNKAITSSSSGSSSSSSSSSSSDDGIGKDTEEESDEIEQAILEDDLTNEIWEPYNPELHVKCNRIIPRDEVFRILRMYDVTALNEVKRVTLTPSSDKKEPPTLQVENKITKGEILSDRLQRFEIMKGHKNARECPSCHLCSVIDTKRKGQRCEYLPAPEAKKEGNVDREKEDGEKQDGEYPVMFAEDIMCNNPQCNHVYCFHHSDAHVGRTCEEYKKENAQYDAESQALIDTVSKRCPGCSIPVSKMEGGGCNHMKCPDCGCAFCWLCGQEIEDTVFPSHFAYWNLTSRCTNMQMDPNLEVTTWARISACVTTYSERLVLGPLAMVSTIVSLLLCCCFVPVLLHNQVDSLQYGNGRPNPRSNVTAHMYVESEHLLGVGKEEQSHEDESVDMENGLGADVIQQDTAISDFDGPSAAQEGANGGDTASDLKEEAGSRALSKELLDGPLEMGEVEVVLRDLEHIEAGQAREGKQLLGEEEAEGQPLEAEAAQRARPSTGRALEILLGNCMGGWSLVWGMFLVGVPAGALALAGSAVFLVFYALYMICVGVGFALELIKQRIKQATGHGTATSITTPDLLVQPVGLFTGGDASDFSSVPASEDPGPDRQEALEITGEDLFVDDDTVRRSGGSGTGGGDGATGKEDEGRMVALAV